MPVNRASRGRTATSQVEVHVPGFTVGGTAGSVRNRSRGVSVRFGGDQRRATLPAAPVIPRPSRCLQGLIRGFRRVERHPEVEILEENEGVELQSPTRHWLLPLHGDANADQTIHSEEES